MKLENYGVRQGGLSRRGYSGRYRVGGLQLFGDYFWHEAQNRSCQDRYGLQPALYASANNGSRAGVSFLEVMERFKGTDAGKVVFKVQRDMEVLGK